MWFWKMESNVDHEEISHLPLTFAIIIRIPRVPVFDVPVPHAPPSHTWCPQVPCFASPSPKSPHTCPDVPIPLSRSHFYIQPQQAHKLTRLPWLRTLYEVKQSKFAFIIVITKINNLCQWPSTFKKCPRNLDSEFKKWVEFQTKAQISSKVHFMWQIWWPVQESGRSMLYLGDSRVI